MLVTDIEITKGKGTKKERKTRGFYMDGYLMENLDGIPWFLGKAWDCVGIISGHGKVRIGKSTMASQTAYYIAWRLAGGEMVLDEDRKVKQVISPTKPVRFNLKENMVFSAEQLQERANTLYEKYGKNQVILYDEGRQGLDSARAMESINKGMEDFFQECGFMGHVILIVIPNYFKLHEDYAIARSIFLIDVFADKNFNRGYFNFYNERQKELLYFFGKKRIGISAKYASANESFWGRFGPWLPFDKDKYETMKKDAMEKKRLRRRERNLILQRDVLVWLLNKRHKIKLDKIREELAEIGDVDIAYDTMKHIISRVNELNLKKKGW